MNELFDLSGRTAVVTGASRGLGQYFARALARAGANLVISSRTRSSLTDFREEVEAMGRRAVALELDVTDASSIRRFAAESLKAFDHIDILVNNAGLNIRKPALDVSWDEWDTILDTNLKSQFFCSQAFAPHMIDRGYGRIVNVGSCTSVFGMEGIVPYTASRGGVLQMTKALAAEWGGHGVTINCLAPGWFETAQNRVLYQNQEWVGKLNERIPLGRPGHPSDLDGTMVFLASEASAYVTGQIVLVDGGFTTGSFRAVVPGGGV